MLIDSDLNQSNPRTMSNNPIKEKSFAFSISVVQVCRKIALEEKEYILTRQLTRSGTSIGANIEEAQDAQSTKDFVSKMSIALKEARETMYWLRIVSECEISKSQDINKLIDRCDELISLLVSIVKSCKAKL